MGERRGARLAARLRARIDADRQAEAEQKAKKKAVEAKARAERKALLADLAAFGEAIGHLDVTVAKDVVILGLGSDTLRFEAQGIADRIRVKGLDPEPRLFLHPELERWVVLRETAPGREDQELLFDTGLERLMAEAFELAPAQEEPVSVEAISVDSTDESKRTL